jgi:adenosylcobinamide kinase/adenosylcobinamide-phosphate guanylyltransferase
MLELILGGARSGKSTLALRRAEESGREVVFIATATASDAEMRERIERHRRERPAQWQTRECPIELASTLREIVTGRFVVVDCLTLWLTNILFPHSTHDDLQIDESTFARETENLYEFLQHYSGNAVFVSNEVGWGLVPDNPIGRRFRDEQGRLNQRIAALCDRVTLVAAGLPLTLKEQRPALSSNLAPTRKQAAIRSQ